MSRFICSTGTRVFHAVNDTEAAERRPNALWRRRGVKVTSSLAGYHRWTAAAATPMMSWSCAREARRRHRTKVWKHGQEQRSDVPEKNRHILTRNNEQENKTLPSSDHSPRIQESAPSYFVIFRWSIIVHIALRCLFSFLNTRRPSNNFLLSWQYGCSIQGEPHVENHCVQEMSNSRLNLKPSADVNLTFPKQTLKKNLWLSLNHKVELIDDDDVNIKTFSRRNWTRTPGVNTRRFLKCPEDIFRPNCGSFSLHVISTTESATKH